MTRKERALRNLKQMCSDGRYLGVDCIDNGDACCQKEFEESMQDLVTENTLESMSKEMIAAHILESINEGFDKERLLDSWFGDNRERDVAFKRAVLALRTIDKIRGNMEEYVLSCLDLR